MSELVQETAGLDRIAALLDELIEISAVGTRYSTLGTPDVVTFAANNTGDYLAGKEFASVAIVNPNAVALYVGLKSAAGVAGKEIVTVPALGWMVLPYRGDELSVGAGAYAGSCYVLPFTTVQPFSAGLIGAATGTAVPAANSTVAKDALTGAVQTLLAANAARKGGAIYNDSTVTLYVKLGDVATLDDWTVKLNPNDYYEIPGTYGGKVTAISSAASGQARVTELS